LLALIDQRLEPFAPFQKRQIDNRNAVDLE